MRSYLLWRPVVNKRASESLLCWNVTKMHQERWARAQQPPSCVLFIRTAVRTNVPSLVSFYWKLQPKRGRVWEIPPWNTHTHTFWPLELLKISLGCNRFTSLTQNAFHTQSNVYQAFGIFKWIRVFVTECFSGGGHLEHVKESNGKFVSF